IFYHAPAPTQLYTLSLHDALPISDFLYPDRIILGADSQEAAATMKAIYAPLTSGQYYQSHRVTPWGETVAEYKAIGNTDRLSGRSEEHTSELQSRENLVCRLLLEK